MRKFLASQKAIVFLLLVQFIPLIFIPPASSFPAPKEDAFQTFLATITMQDWWLPFILTILGIVAFVQIVARRSTALGPWYLLSFVQGFNIISRLLMLVSHASKLENKVQVLNTQYVVFSILAMAISAFLLWYFELPDVRMGWLKK